MSLQLSLVFFSIYFPGFTFVFFSWILVLLFHFSLLPFLCSNDWLAEVPSLERNGKPSSIFVGCFNPIDLRLWSVILSQHKPFLSIYELAKPINNTLLEPNCFSCVPCQMGKDFFLTKTKNHIVFGRGGRMVLLCFPSIKKKFHQYLFFKIKKKEKVNEKI